MDWREARIGAGVNPGWVPVVDRLHAAVLRVEPNVVVDQVKEKFGGLRYYYTLPKRVLSKDSGWTRDEIDGLVGAAEAECERTCEVCGDPSEGPNAEGGYWLHTLCEKHARVKREVGTPAWKMAQDEGRL